MNFSEGLDLRPRNLVGRRPRLGYFHRLVCPLADAGSARVFRGQDSSGAGRTALECHSATAKKVKGGLQLPLLRAWQLAFTRMGKPDAATCARLAAQFDPLFPHADAFVNRELVSLLIFLDSPTVVAKTIPLLSVSEPVGSAPEEQASKALLDRNDRYGKVVNSVTSSRPDRQQIAYAYNLRHATVGWTPKLRVEFFSWFPRTASWKGGNSFSGFLQNIRTESLAHVSDPAESAALNALSKPAAASFAAGAITPKGPGRSYTVAEATALAQGHLTGRDFAEGKGLFAATACLICHRFNNDGGGVGPDLSGAGNRYSVKDLLENIIEPAMQRP